MIFFHCFDCRKDGNDGKRALSSSADGRGSRPKASQREAKAIIVSLYSILCASSLQCSPRLVYRCVRTSQVHPLCPTSSKCARLRRAFHFPFSSTCTHPLFFPSLLMLRQVAPALPFYLLLFAKRKAKTPQHATRIAQHALSNTSCATQTRQSERSKLCYDGLKEL